MAYELRDFYNATVIDDVARDLKRAYSAFNVRAFTKQCLDGLAAMRLQYEITQRFSAEFSIRAFLNAHPEAPVYLS